MPEQAKVESRNIGAWKNREHFTVHIDRDLIKKVKKEKLKTGRSMLSIIEECLRARYARPIAEVEESA